MDYCGVEFTATESATGSSWQWQILLPHSNKMKSSGKASSRGMAIKHAHEAIGEGFRACAIVAPKASLSTIGGVLHFLHGARSLPPAEVANALRPFLVTMRDQFMANSRIANASLAAVGALVERLETEGRATDDLWEVAIESSLSFACEASLRGSP